MFPTQIDKINYFRQLRYILFFLIGAMLYFFDFFVLGKTPLSTLFGLSDSLTISYPLHFASISSLKKGVFPLWNPFIMCGNPLFITPAPLSPFNIVYLFLSSFKAYTLSLMLQVFFTGIFMFYYLLKGIRLGREAALLGGVVFMFSPFLLKLLPHGADTGVLLWMPLVLLFFELSMQRGDIYYALLAGLTLGVSCYSGTLLEPFYICLFLFSYAFYRSLIIYKDRRKIKYAFQPLYLLGITGFVTLLVFAARLLPTIELMRLSQRGGEHLFEGLPLIYFTGILFPLGPIRIGQTFILSHFGYPYLLYAGTVSIFLIIITFLYRNKDYLLRLFFILFFGISILVVTMNYFPFKLYLVKILPLFGTLPLERLAYLYPFLLAVIAASGYNLLAGESLISKGLNRLAKLLCITYWLGTISFIFLWAGKGIFKGLIVSMFQTAFKFFFSGRGPYINSLNYYLNKFSYVYDQALLPSFAMMIVIILLFRTGSLVIFLKILKERKLYFKFSSLLVSLLALELIFTAKLFNPFTYDIYNIYRDSKEVVFLKTLKPMDRIEVKINTYFKEEPTRGDREYKLDYSKEDVDLSKYRLGLRPNIPILLGASMVGGYESLYPKRFGEFILLTQRDDPNYFLRKSEMADRTLLLYTTIVEITSIDSLILDLAGMKYVFSRLPLTHAKLKFLFKGEDYYIYENLNVLPRAFLVSDVKIISAKEDIFNAMGDAKFNPSREVILEEAPPLGFGDIKEDSPKDKNYSVEITNYQSNKVTIQAISDRDAILVLTDSFYPGWKASIDGKKTKIYVADYVFRAIPFPKGKHIVNFIYDPFSFKLGAIISLITLSLLIFAGVYRLITRYK